MATKIIDNNGLVSFDSISSEEDLKLSPRININPPPADRRCNCCGRHLSELKPFDKSESFEGALLVKSFRTIFRFKEEAETAWDKAVKHLAEAGYKDKDPLEWMIKQYGKEMGEDFYWSCQGQGYGQINNSWGWECRDCVVLNNEEYHDRLSQRLEQESDNE